jgi:putative ABC transport system substrate-binding protein
MRRREFIAAIGGAATWPVAAHAQQAAMPIVGYLGSETRERYPRGVHSSKGSARWAIIKAKV